MAMRLYVAGFGDSMIFCTAQNHAEARTKLGKGVRNPDPDDVRAFWTLMRMDMLPSSEIMQRFGVSRQTIYNWWKKAGGEGLPRRREQMVQDRINRVKAELLRERPHSPTTIAKRTRVSLETVKKMAEEYKVEFPGKYQIRPSDEELVRLATGRTWYEFADAVGMALASLRAYIYKNPELAAEIRKVRKPVQSSGYTRGKGKIPRVKVIKLLKEGHSAYRIAQILKVEQMSVRRWLRRFVQEAKANDKARDEREIADLMANGGRGTLRYPR